MDQKVNGGAWSNNKLCMILNFLKDPKFCETTWRHVNSQKFLREKKLSSVKLALQYFKSFPDMKNKHTHEIY